MKVNEAPEKIYISNFDIEVLPKNEQLSECWHEVSTEDTDIEYTRTDAFIEKAARYLNSRLYDIVGVVNFGSMFESLILKEELVDEFRKYMKGE